MTTATLLIPGNNSLLLTCESFDDALTACRREFCRGTTEVRVEDTLIWKEGIDVRDIRPGYYALDGRRYHVDGGKGSWGGWLFLRTGSDYHEPTNLAAVTPEGRIVKTVGRGKSILTAIASDPVARSAEYGRITGTCGVCGRKLENPVSLARGIGPICEQRL